LVPVPGGTEMVEPLSGLAKRDVLASHFQKRSKEFDEKLISASNKKSLQMKLDAEALEGRSLLKKNKKSLRLKSPKPLDRMLETKFGACFTEWVFQN
jgi:hypothetical protein